MRTRRLAALIPLIAGLAIVAFALTRPSPRAFQTEAIPDAPITVVSGARVCQTVVVPPTGRFDSLVLQLAYEQPASRPVPVTVRRQGGGRVLARGSLGTGRPPGPESVAVQLDRAVAPDQTIDVCLNGRRQRGEIVVFGSGVPRYTDPLAIRNGEVIGARMFIIFLRDGVSRMDTLGDMTRRASLFRTRWLEPWMLGTLIGLVLLGVPLLLSVALARSRE